MHFRAVHRGCRGGHSGMGGLVGILVGFELRVSGHSLKPTEYEYIVVCFKSYVFMVKNEF